MVGKQQIQIAGDQLATGLSTADNLSDGFVGSASVNIHPFIAQGEVYATVTTAKTGLSAAIVASCEDWRPVDGSGYRWLIDSAGELFKVDSAGTITDIMGTGCTPDVTGITDMCVFEDGATNPAIYISTASDVCQVTHPAGYSGTPTWLSSHAGGAALGATRHPLLVYQNIMWVGDGKKLWSYTTGDTLTVALTLDSQDSITALGIDPSTGLMMVGVVVRKSSAAIYPAQTYIGLYDGYSSKFRRRIPVSGTIAAFKSIGGKVAVIMDNSIGLWNGYGIDFVRRLSVGGLIPSQRIAVVNNILFICDGHTLLAFGDVLNGKKSWWPIYHGSTNITAIFRGTATTIALNDNSSSIKSIDLYSVGLAGTGTVVTNNINFPRPVYIRRLRIFTSGVTSSSGGTTGIGGVGVIDENGTTNVPLVTKFVVAAGTKYVFDFDFTSLKLQTMQPTITLDTQVFSIRKIIAYYDVAE